MSSCDTPITVAPSAWYFSVASAKSCASIVQPVVNAAGQLALTLINLGSQMNDAVDMVTVIEFLRKSDKLEAAGGNLTRAAIDFG